MALEVNSLAKKFGFGASGMAIDGLYTSHSISLICSLEDWGKNRSATISTHTGKTYFTSEAIVIFWISVGEHMKSPCPRFVNVSVEVINVLHQISVRIDSPVRSLTETNPWPAPGCSCAADVNWASCKHGSGCPIGNKPGKRHLERERRSHLSPFDLNSRVVPAIFTTDARRKFDEEAPRASSIFCLETQIWDGSETT